MPGEPPPVGGTMLYSNVTIDSGQSVTPTDPTKVQRYQLRLAQPLVLEDDETVQAFAVVQLSDQASGSAHELQIRSETENLMWQLGISDTDITGASTRLSNAKSSGHGFVEQSLPWSVDTVATDIRLDVTKTSLRAFARQHGTIPWTEIPQSGYAQTNGFTTIHAVEIQGSQGWTDSVILQVIPEPAMAVLLGLGSLALLRRKREAESGRRRRGTVRSATNAVACPWLEGHRFSLLPEAAGYWLT